MEVIQSGTQHSIETHRLFLRLRVGGGVGNMANCILAKQEKAFRRCTRMKVNTTSTGYFPKDEEHFPFRGSEPASDEQTLFVASVPMY